MPQPTVDEPSSPTPGSWQAWRDGGMLTRVEHIMGTAVSIAVCTQDDEPWGSAVDQAIEEAFASLRRADAVFSPYRPDSQISRLRDGRVSLDRCDPDVRTVLSLCEDLRRATAGYFDAYAAGPGRLDPCGLVKGWAAECASDALIRGGVPAHYVNAGGDVRLRGRPAPGGLWRVGIADPHRPGHLIATVHGSDFAIATSGTAERGAHVLDPHRGVPARELASVTVAGPSLTLADAYATAAVAMGVRALPWLTALDGYEALLVDADGAVHRSASFESRYLSTRRRSHSAPCLKIF
jgi:FAD:protein FMN transferase